MWSLKHGNMKIRNILWTQTVYVALRTLCIFCNNCLDIGVHEENSNKLKLQFLQFSRLTLLDLKQHNIQISCSNAV